MDDLKRNSFTTLTKLQNELWKILTSNNNGEPDSLRIANCKALIGDFINSEPDEYNVQYKCPKQENRCSSCEFWTEHKREGTCTQKVKLSKGRLSNQITFEDYGCTTYQKEGTVEYKNKF